MPDYESSKYLLFANYLRKNYSLLYRKFAVHLKYDETVGLYSSLNASDGIDEDFEDLKFIWSSFDPVEIRTDKRRTK